MARVRLPFLAAAVLFSCTPARPPSGSSSGSMGSGPQAANDPPLARVGDVEIRRSQVAAQMRLTGKAEREALDDLIAFELLALAAAHAVPPSDPDVHQAQAAMLVQRLIERELEPHLTKADVPDSALREVYDRAQKVFVHPRLVEVAILNVYTGPRMKPEPRAKAAATARALDDYLQKAGRHSLEDFEAVASDPAWKERKVHFSRDWQAIDDPFPIEVGREVQRLTRVGQRTPLVTSQTGFHVATYLGERPAENVSFTDARDKLRDQIFERWRAARFLEFSQTLAGSHTVEADPDRLSAAAP
jgi:hypothetical protein